MKIVEWLKIVLMYLGDFFFRPSLSMLEAGTWVFVLAYAPDDWVWLSLLVIVVSFGVSSYMAKKLGYEG